MIKGIHLQESYSPVATWNSIRTMLILAAQHNWHMVQIDYVLAFPQATKERTLYMEIPKGFELEDCHDHREYVLKLHRNVYRSKNAGRTWYQYRSQKLVEEVGFEQSKADDCVYYKGMVMYILYTDDSILAGPDQSDIEQVIKDIQLTKLNITVEGDIQDFLGIRPCSNHFFEFEKQGHDPDIHNPFFLDTPFTCSNLFFYYSNMEHWILTF
jgi:Reverse transcriptase (RNA-dependent DNA polymerase)